MNLELRSIASEATRQGTTFYSIARQRGYSHVEALRVDMNIRQAGYKPPAVMQEL